MAFIEMYVSVKSGLNITPSCVNTKTDLLVLFFVLIISLSETCNDALFPFSLPICV